MMRLSTMTFISVLGHITATFVLLMLSMFQPIRIKKPPPQKIVDVRMIERTPVPVKPSTPNPQPPKPTVSKKAIERKTPTPTQRKTPKPTEKKTAKPTKKITPKPTKSPTPKPRTPRPTERETPKPATPKPATPKRTQPPAVITPDAGKTVAFQESLLSDFGYYLAMAAMKIESNFTLPRHLRTKGITCTVRITILRDGRIENIQVLKSTGDSVMDSYAVNALKRTATLPPLPEALEEDHVIREILFDYALPND